MAETRILVNPQTLPGAYPTLQPGAGSRKITFAACDASNFNRVVIVENKTVILVKNAHVSDPKTVTIVSAVDDKNRTGDITAYSIVAGDIAVFGPFKTAGWTTTGHLELRGASTDIQFACITLP
jgi:hypothetical protein